MPGFVVDMIEEAVAAVRRVADLDLAKVRAAFERRFTAERMARDYVALYRQLLAGRAQPVEVAMLNGTQDGWRAVQPSRRGPDAIDGHNGVQFGKPISAPLFPRSAEKYPRQIVERPPRNTLLSSETEGRAELE